MAALTPTKVITTELAGDAKFYVATVVPTTASDTITFVAATHKFRTIYAIIPVITAGMDANLLTAHTSFSGLVVTLTTLGADGLAATDWTSAVVKLVMLVGSA